MEGPEPAQTQLPFVLRGSRLPSFRSILTCPGKGLERVRVEEGRGIVSAHMGKLVCKYVSAVMIPIEIYTTVHLVQQMYNRRISGRSS